MSANREMILTRPIRSRSHQLMVTLDDLFQECPGIRDYNREKMGDVLIMHVRVKEKGTFIVMYTHDERLCKNVIAYKMTDNFKGFVQFYIRFYVKGYIGKSLTMLEPTDDWKHKFGFH